MDPLPYLARALDDRVHVLREHVAVRDELARRASRVVEVRRLRGIALLDGGPRVAVLLALGAGAGEPEGRSHHGHDVMIAALVGMARVPAAVGRERRRELRAAYPRDLVAVGVDRGDVGAVGRSHLRRVRRYAALQVGAEIEPQRTHDARGKGRARQAAE